jgi:predicted Zn finger-like uncharacterized protein
MVVECTQCHAKFRLDDSKITERGVKVRCSKCKHVFIVSKETASKSQQPSPEAPPVAPQQPPKAPPSEPSFLPPKEPPKEKEEAGAGFEFKDEEESHPPESQGFDDGLGELSFGEEKAPKMEPPPAPPPPEPDVDFGDFSLKDDKTPPPAAEPPGDMDDFGDFDFDDELAAESGASAPTPPPPPPPPAKPESDDLLGDMPDFSAPEPTPPSPPPSGGGGLAADFGGEDFGEDFDLGSTPPLPPSQPSVPPKAPAPPPLGGDNPEEFGDISLDDSASAPPKQPAPPTPPKPEAQGPSEFGDLDIDRGIGGRTMDEFKEVAAGAEDSYAFNVGATDEPESDIPMRPQTRAGVHEPTPPPMERPRQRVAREIAPPSRKGGAKFLIGIIVIAALGGGLFFLNKEASHKGIKLSELNFEKFKEIIGLKKPQLPQNKWEIKFNPGSQGFYPVDRSDGARLWVLRGAVINYFMTDKRAILIEGSIQDADKVVKKSRSMVGNKLTDSELQTLPVEKIQETLMNSTILDENLDPFFMRPGKSAEFIIVFDNIASPNPPKPSLNDVKVIDSVNL